MKRIFLYITLLTSLLTGCYDNEGKNDFDTALPDVSITIPGDAYSASVGGTITIDPVVKTDISENDLEYRWEVLGDSLNSENHRAFFPLVDSLQQGKRLVYQAKFDNNITILNNPYTCRLHVIQKSTGRDFYSANTFTITISGTTGLMILHGDDTSSDIGILSAKTFTPMSLKEPDTASVVPNVYSNSNGHRLNGAPKSITQAVTNYLTTYAAYYPTINDRAGKILAQTDKTTEWIDRESFNRLGDWNYMFYGEGNEKQNSGEPGGIFAYQLYIFAFDGGSIFGVSPLQQKQFLFPECTPETQFPDGNTYSFAPVYINTHDTYYPGMLWTNSVNGDKSKKGFVGLRLPRPGYITRYGVLLDTKNDNVVFNPGDMKADLIHMGHDNRGHVLAVLRGDADNAQFAGKIFAVDMQPSGTATANSATPYSGIGKYMYDLSGFTNINNAISFEFGATQNQCYYATSTVVYRYSLDAGNVTQPEALGMVDGSAWNPDGEITMMKLLDTSTDNTPTRDYNGTTLMVATYSNGNATLWALHLDAMSGRINTVEKFDASTVPGWKFDKIKDVYIKAM